VLLGAANVADAVPMTRAALIAATINLVIIVHLLFARSENIC
jgi:hypothetical protein